MDDLHQKTRDADKSPSTAPGAAQNRPREGSGERQNTTEQMPRAAAGGNKPGDDSTREAGEAVLGDAMNQASTLVRNVGEQAWSAANNAGGTAQEMIRQARDQVSSVSGAVVESGSRANDYIARNVNEYPLAALLIAGAVGYGVGYLLHNSWQAQGEQRSTRPSRNNSKG